MIRTKIQSFILGTLVVTGGAIAISAPAFTYTPNSAHQAVRSHDLAQSTIDTAAIEASVFRQINQFRASQGLPALTRNSSMNNQARVHSQNMADGTTPFGHNGFSQRIQAIAIPYQSAAENVAMNSNYSDPATQAVQGWLHSSGHLNNIRGNYNLTGIGVAANSRGEVYLTQIFLRSSGQNSTSGGSGSYSGSGSSGGSQSTTSTSNAAAIEASVYQQINRFRSTQSLPALTRNSAIDDQARIHSRNMANGNVPFGHTGFSQRIQLIGIPYQGAAENVAMNRNYSDPATQAVQGWLNSSGHLANIRGNYNLTGIGVAINSKGEVYLTQIFLRR
ncbi:MAG: CAP domain-containing protein [Nostoc sp. ChiSLP02]|nr:CAP domain-containing protein [Nostoc sp. DedSLP05]MDZ8101760.1 CAP domain-containing protein [Nostoc sp. DedSLP01]MDZ8184966.1 CAP domain-containing protein [Nostoc sp. ChiSLP02]